MPSRTRALILGTLLTISAVPAGAADLVGAYRWDRDAEGHGGFSGIELSEDGTEFVAISDRSRIVRGRILREDGVITGIEAGPIERLLDLEGDRMSQDYGDSEGLAVGPDGDVYISFEGSASRVWRYDGVHPTDLPRHPDFDLLSHNGALEALAISQDGTLYTMPEVAPGGLPFPVWRLDGEEWDLAFTLEDRGYALVEADFDDRGRLYVLERRFLGIGFQSRVRRIELDGDEVLSDEILFESALREHDNLEGLSVWRDDAGHLRLTMISDDNFIALQRTEIVEYSVPD
ncbi:esterase-like activity of phytase family protein [Palleronia sp. LCG004]|uniref:esterase-like activity of phytase family protein n=1 Tax=Palleronia sp. LCG004 TaxID=3079304 RepID=UPI00294346F6|nr:esterase-like activity of phytase family protein [Palleronia sp. LCG004]WOI56132.1 esterase-like activity of phytase family protein [Palleronia sp. LCG004]